MIAEAHSIPSGYKLTDVGVIPEDWDETPLPEVIWFQEGPGLRKWQFRDRGVKVINVTNLQESGYLDISNTDRHISVEEFERTYKHFLIDPGDFVMASSGNSYCKTSLVRESDLPLLMNTSVIRFKATDRIHKSFMMIYLKSQYFKDQIDLMITGGAQPNFGPVHLARVILPLPPTLAEQEAIAEALGDADALIESLEQLVAKKRHLKQAAMQQLLTGKKRLPGFEGEWEPKRLGNLGSTYGGLTGKTKSHFGHGSARYIPFMNIMYNVVIDPSDLDRVDVHPSEGQNAVEAGDLFFNGSSETPDEVGMCSFLAADLGRVYVNSFCFGFRFREGTAANGLFLAYYLRSQRGRDLLRSLAQGATRYNLSKTALMDIELEIPTPAEQDAITEVLTDMDTEIEAIEAKLAKARQIKQGMMQELLTGRTRLV